MSLTNSSPARATEGANEGVNSVSHFQGCHFCGGSLPGAVHFDSLPFGEGAGDRGVPPSDQLESTERNRFPPKEKFKMEGLHTTRSLLRRGDFMMKLDLKDAYNAVPIHPESRKYLWFYHEGRTYEFCCLPFSLSLAPCFFTTILHPIIARLCSEGIQTVIYLYDLLLIHHQKDQLTEIFNYVRRLSSGLGFIVKLEKCSPEPTHRLVFLGAVLDTTCMSISLPDKQINRIQEACQTMLESQSTSLGELSSLLSCMSHAAWTGL